MLGLGTVITDVRKVDCASIDFLKARKFYSECCSGQEVSLKKVRCIQANPINIRKKENFFV